MFDEILGKRKEIEQVEDDGSHHPISFSEIWKKNQQVMDKNNKNDSEDDYEDLQLDDMGL